MDPDLQAARHRHKQPRQKQKPHQRSAFQKELALNQYALALATVTRTCHLTDVALPRHFLQPLATRFQPSQKPTKRSTDSLESSHVRLVPHLVPEPAVGDSVKRAYVHLSRPVITHLGSKPKSPQYMGLIDQKTLRKYNLTDRKQWVWDKKMSERILHGLRVDVMHALGPLFRHRLPKFLGRMHESGDEEGEGREGSVQSRAPGGHGSRGPVTPRAEPPPPMTGHDAPNAPRSEPETVGVRPPTRYRRPPTLRRILPSEVACQLVFPRTITTTIDDDDDDDTKVDLTAAEMMSQYKQHVQRFDLSALLDSEDIAALRQNTRFEKLEVVAVRRHETAIEAVLALMRLEAYCRSQ